MAKNFIKSFFTFLFLMFGILLAFVYYVDPLQYLRKASYRPIYTSQQRYQLPALARTQDYDSVVIGTSYSQNFNPSIIKKALGFNTLQLAMSSSTLYEQILLLNVALKRGIVKNVIWGLDIDWIYDFRPDQVRDDLAPFPYYLYKHPLFSLHKYLINLEIIMMSIEVFLRESFGLKNKIYVSEYLNLELYNNWQHYCKIPPENLRALDKSLSSEKVRVFDLKELNRIMECDLEESINWKKNLKCITDIIRSHPEINFIIFSPPYSITYLRRHHKHEVINVFLAKHFALLKELLKYKNVSLYAFFNREDIIMNLDNYRDIAHYWQNVNDEIILSFKQNTNKISREEDIVKYISEICRLINKSNKKIVD